MTPSPRTEKPIRNARERLAPHHQERLAPQRRERLAPHRREQSLGEEIANSVSHGAGLVATLVAVPVLIISAVQRGGPADIVGASVFAATMIVLYLTSTLYHALPRNRAKRILRVMDHAAIYLLIAGTYTPFTLGVLRGGWGWTLFGLVWGLGITGIVLKTLGRVQHPWVSTCIYVVMGWIAIIAVRPLIELVPAYGLLWLVAGGVAYTGGVAFFAAERVRYSHFVWHLCVLAGTSCHFVAVLRYAA